MKTILGAIAVAVVCSVPIAAQWPKYEEAGIPETQKGAYGSTRRHLEHSTGSLIYLVFGRELTGTRRLRSLLD